MTNQTVGSFSADSSSGSTWHDVASKDELSDGQSVLVHVDEQPILVCLTQGRYYAVGHNCPHYDAPMEEGKLVGSKIICPWHWWEFDLNTGYCLYAPTEQITDLFFSSEFLGDPQSVKLPTYPIHVESGRIFVQLPSEIIDSRNP